MVIPLLCVFSSSFIQAEFNVYCIESMGLQHLALQEWDPRAPGSSGLLPWLRHLCVQWSWGAEPAWAGTRESSGYPHSAVNKQRHWQMKGLAQKLKLQAGFPGGRTDICAAGVSSSHQEQHSA